MPVVKTGNITYKALPILIHEGGSATVTITTLVDGVAVQQRQIELAAGETGPLFAAMPAPGKSRWDDLAEALYGLLIAQGEIVGAPE